MQTMWCLNCKFNFSYKVIVKVLSSSGGEGDR